MTISEKTIELLVISELYHMARLGGYSPIIIGPTQREEMLHGQDARIHFNSRILILQFKKGKHRTSGFYSYSINNNYPRCDQHHNFLWSSSRSGKYVCPLFSEENELFLYRGRILSKIYFWPVIDIKDFNPEIGHAHTLRLYPDGRRSVRSKEKVLQGKWNPVFKKESINFEKKNFYREFFDEMDLLTVEEFILQTEVKRQRGSVIRDIPGFNNKTYPIILTE